MYRAGLPTNGVQGRYIYREVSHLGVHREAYMGDIPTLGYPSERLKQGINHPWDTLLRG